MLNKKKLGRAKRTEGYHGLMAQGVAITQCFNLIHLKTINIKFKYIIVSIPTEIQINHVLGSFTSSLRTFYVLHRFSCFHQ